MDMMSDHVCVRWSLYFKKDFSVRLCTILNPSLSIGLIYLYLSTVSKEQQKQTLLHMHTFVDCPQLPEHIICTTQIIERV